MNREKIKENNHCCGDIDS